MGKIVLQIVEFWVVAALGWLAQKNIIPKEVATDANALTISLAIIGGISLAYVAVKAYVVKLWQQRKQPQTPASTAKTSAWWIALVILPLFVIGCASTSTPATTTTLPSDPSQNAQFVSAVNAASSILKTAGTALLQYAVSGTERTEYAELLSGSGHIFYAFETGTLPTSAQITNAYSAYFPNSYSSYATIAQAAASAVVALEGIIEQYIPSDIKTSNAAVYAAYVNYALNALAQVCFDVADPFLPATGN